MAFNENWDDKRTILVILAHPDDPEFFCGATIARWSAAGHAIHYLLFTKGDKGSNDSSMAPDNLANIRVKEQREAGDILGVKTITYLDKKDGYIIPDLDTRKEIVRHIRKLRPQIVVTSDPANLTSRPGYINHPDHRYVGLQVIDAIYPAADNMFFFPELIQEGINPIKISELWLSIPDAANTVIDVTATWPLKIKALTKHVSQVGDQERFIKRINNRYKPVGAGGKRIFEERFKRIVFK